MKKLIAISTLAMAAGGSPAAKLCQTTNMPNGPKTATAWAGPNGCNTDALFLVGEGCTGGWNGSTPGSCAKVYAAGEAIRTSTNCDVGQLSLSPGTPGSGGAHWCRLFGKQTWVCANPVESTTCAGHYCANSIIENRAAFVSGLFGSL